METINKKRQTDEIRRCARDPIYFFKTYVRVSHPTKGPIPFDTFDFQDECVKSFLEHRYVIVNKSRQLGLSTLAAAYAAWLLIFHRNKEVIIMATKLKVAMNFIRKVKFCVQNLPPWLVLPKIVEDNKQSLVFGFPSNSRIEAIPTAADAGRSEALSLLIVDEAAHVADFEELWKGLYPTLSCVVGGTKVLLDDGFHDIEELCKGYVPGDYFSLSGKIFGKDGLEELSHGYVSPESETLKITTTHGLQLEVTHKHPLWTIDATAGGKMVQAQNLHVGDYLRVQHSMGIYGNDDTLDHPSVKRITPELAYLLGGWIAEGWISRDYSVTVSNTDEEFRTAYLKNDVIKRFVEAQNHKLICYSKDMVELFKLMGVDSSWKCDTKRVPSKLWRCSESIQTAFLRGYFDGDGSCGNDGIVSACSTSHSLLLDIQQLMLNMGFLPSVIQQDDEKLKKMVGKFIGNNKNPVKSVRQAWSIMLPRSQAKKFLEKIGFAIDRKQERLKNFSFKCDDSHVHVVSRKSGVGSRIRSIGRESGLTLSWFGDNGVPMGTFNDDVADDDRGYTAKTLRGFRDLLVCKNRISERDLLFLNEICGGDFTWSKITSINESHGKTYDFTVPKSHSFLQNSILGSNTGGRALIISTPKGVGNWFHKLWVDAQDGSNEFHPIELPWQVHPERDEEWFREQTANMSTKAIAQELLCVGGTTRIITKNGFKHACDIVVGDEVLTHKGRFKKVLKTHQRLVQDENVYAISTPMNRQTDIIVTGNHPVLSLKTSNGKIGWAGGISKWLDNTRPSELKFNTVDDLSSYNNQACTNRVKAALFPILQDCMLDGSLNQVDLSELILGSEVMGNDVRYPRQWGSNKRYIPVDFSLGRFLGLWLSDGYANPNDRFGVGFGFHIDEYETLLKFVDTYLSGFGVKTRPSKSSYSNACRIETHNQFFVKLIRMFTHGHYAHDKMLNWDVIAKTNREFIRGILVGYYEGDGDHRPERKLKVVSVHSQLLYQVRTLLSMFGHYPRIGHWKHQPAYLEFDCAAGRKLDELLVSDKSTMLEKSGSRTRILGDYFIGTSKFRLLADDEKDGLRVYNFEVEDDHTYVADSLVVHNCDFLSSGDTYLDASDIEWVGKSVKKPIMRAGPDNNVWIWEEPIKDPDVRYVIPADVGRGDGNDFSTFHVLCMTSGEVVAEFRGKIRPDHFAKLLMEYGKKYNNAMICPERNTYGHHVIIELVNHGYTSIYFKNQKGVFIGDYIPPDRISDAGFDTQKESRKQIIAKLEEVIRNKQIKVYSSRLHNELKTFITQGDKPQAQKNCHDDLVMALAIGTWLFDASAVHSQFAQNLNKAMIAGFGMNSNNFDNLAGNGNEVLPSWVGMVPYAGAQSMPQINQRRVRPKDDDPSDISWLMK